MTIKNKPVPVEGQLVVYGYDDTDDKREKRRSPDRKYAFTPEQFTQHFGESELGASYSVWIPWDEAGSEQKNISLLPVFTATSGRIVMGQQALNVLPGKKTDAYPRRRIRTPSGLRRLRTSRPQTQVSQPVSYSAPVPHSGQHDAHHHAADSRYDAATADDAGRSTERHKRIGLAKRAHHTPRRASSSGHRLRSRRLQCRGRNRLRQLQRLRLRRRRTHGQLISHIRDPRLQQR